MRATPDPNDVEKKDKSLMFLSLKLAAVGSKNLRKTSASSIKTDPLHACDPCRASALADLISAAVPLVERSVAGDDPRDDRGVMMCPRGSDEVV